MKNYITNGRVARTEIACDICDGILTKDDISCLVKDSRIRAAFIGTSFNQKIPKNKWNSKYIRILPGASVAEAFNEDYLYYIADVVEYVNEKNKAASLKKRIALGSLAVILICIIIFLIVKSRS